MTAPADTPKTCEQCKQRPKSPGRGRRFCAPCAENRVCLKCATDLKRRADGNLTCGKCNTTQKMKKYNEDPDAFNTARYLKKYGLTAEDYGKLQTEADGKCAICQQEPDGSRHEGRLHIDHDHVTGKVRGLLCGRCNKALGLVRDDVDVLQNMIKYLS